MSSVCQFSPDLNNSKTFRYREEFCIVFQRILEKCTGFKKRPLEKRYPNICVGVQSLQDKHFNQFCANNVWKPQNCGIKNCSELQCYIEDDVIRYAKENLVMLHVLIKDPYVKRYLKDEKMPVIST